MTRPGPTRQCTGLGPPTATRRTLPLTTLELFSTALGLTTIWVSLNRVAQTGDRGTALHGSNDLKFYVDGVNVITQSQPAVAANAYIRRAYMGYNYNVNQDTYWDDVTFESPAPATPTNVAGTALSTTSIRWSFTDNANNENGFRLYNGATKVAERGDC